MGERESRRRAPHGQGRQRAANRALLPCPVAILPRTQVQTGILWVRQRDRLRSFQSVKGCLAQTKAVGRRAAVSYARCRKVGVRAAVRTVAAVGRR